ncbi:MAG TPA: tetratricopeptide repeat protein [Pyrinomonadaceae bacterium]|jgi:hypothetical protein|nr:tetratricopeptide repeat protein [Pyrinomonadaceae bacterium]
MKMDAKLHKALLLVCALGVLCGSSFIDKSAAQTAKQSDRIVDMATAQNWREDLRYFASEMPKRHKNLFHVMTREEFELAVRRLDEQIPRLTQEQIVVELQRIVAMIRDGHTRIQDFPFGPKIGFHSYPVYLYQYKDGLFVQAAGPAYKDAVGARVIKIGKDSAQQAIDAVSPLVCRDGDNDMSIEAIAPSFLVTPEILHALGIVDDPENAAFVVERNGRQQTVNLKPSADQLIANHGPTWRKPANWIDARDGARAPTPLWLKYPQDFFWFEYLTELRTVYFQYNIIANKENETVAEFAKRLFDFLDTHPVDRFVIDLRLNGGGNNFLNRPLLLGIIRTTKIDQPGKLFAIIGRQTFSAAQDFVDELENYTNVTFVGEPTGESPNQFGDPASVVLPNSGITVRASTLWWQFVDPRDTRKWTGPKIAAELTSEDYRNNIDPAMDAILKYVPKKELVVQMREALDANQTAQAIAAYRAFKSNPQNQYVETEASLNRLGYELMARKKYSQAIEILKLNVESYPQSANVYDSLGEAYMMNGEKELAIKNYEKSLSLNPVNEGAAAALKKLRGN